LSWGIAMLQVTGEVVIITAEDVYQALCSLERRKQTAPLPTLAGASEAETLEEGCEHPLSAVIISQESIP